MALTIFTIIVETDIISMSVEEVLGIIKGNFLHLKITDRKDRKKF